jgi:hypothetical protein
VSEVRISFSGSLTSWRLACLKARGLLSREVRTRCLAKTPTLMIRPSLLSSPSIDATRDIARPLDSGRSPLAVEGLQSVNSGCGKRNRRPGRGLQYQLQAAHRSNSRSASWPHAAMEKCSPYGCRCAESFLGCAKCAATYRPTSRPIAVPTRPEER